MAVHHKILIGIDFGTTYSGVAWADSTSPRDVTPIRQWPGAAGRVDVDKVPSEIIYMSNGSFKWGFETTSDFARRSGKLLQYMKLLLDPTQETGTIADPLGLAQMRASIPFNKSPVDVVADYLSALKQHALNVLSGNFGSNFWNVIPVEYHLTIPAVWSEAAKALTLQAANRAGIGNGSNADGLLLIAEPEAAALYCVTDMYPGLLKPGDTFVVCDCGGGTVDLVSYRVIQREPRFQVKEVAVGGGLCGSVFLNRRFESFVRSRLGSEVVNEMIRKGRPYHRMMKDFDERLKRDFRDSEENVMDCEVPTIQDSIVNRVTDGFMEIDRTEMKQIFNPVINEILRLVSVQIETVQRTGQLVSSVILVGGFGSSAYLKQKLEDNLAFRYPGNSMTVLQPTNAWSAVARGAVICGLQSVQIRSRQARRNYGIAFRTKFDESIHPINKRVWCPYSEEYRCDDRMKWYVKEGDEVTESKHISMSFFRCFDLNSSLTFSDTLLASNSPRHQAEEDATDKNIYPVCTLHTDISKVKHLLEIRKNSKGVPYYHVDFDLVMYIHSSQLTFGFEFKGVKYGDVTRAAFV